MGKQFEGALKKAVVHMDPYDAITIFDNANVTISQMRTIKQYLRW
jgi:hypothetical protein